MNILMTGGTGLIGRRLCADLLRQGHQLTVLSRQPATVARLCGQGVSAMDSLDAYTPDRVFDAVINLAGEPIIGARWTAARKARLRESRIFLTECLVQKMREARVKPAVFLSGSAIGVYGDTGADRIDETRAAGGDFGAQLCVDWEAAALSAARDGIRVVLLRTGVVLDTAGGALTKMLLPFRLGLGGKIGDGQQWMSWIHYQDYVGLISLLLQDQRISGSVNMVAPGAVTNAEFTQALAAQLHRPALLTTPAWALKLAMGEMAMLLTGGQRVLPARAQRAGFQFKYPKIDGALAALLSAAPDA